MLEYGATKQMPLEGTKNVGGKTIRFRALRIPAHFLRPSETVERIKAYILADPEIADDKTKFVEGWGWDHTKWMLEEWPTYVCLQPRFVHLSLADTFTACARSGSRGCRPLSGTPEQRRTCPLGFFGCLTVYGTPAG